MQTRRVTITVPEDLLEAAHRAVQAGRARSVSAWFSDAAREQGSRESLSTILEDWHQEFGPVSDGVAEAAETQMRQLGIEPAPRRSASSRRMAG